MSLIPNFRQLNPMFVFYTGTIIVNHFAYGINANMIGPSLVDMQYVYHTSVDAMLYLNCLISIGYMTGSLVGYFYRWLNRQLTIAFSVGLIAICFAALPFCSQVWFLYVVTFVYGVGTGAWDSSTSVWLVEMWTVKSSAFLQALHFAFATGSIFGPMLVAPYLYGEEGRLNGLNTTIHVSAEKRQRSLAEPFSISSGLQSIVPVILLITYFIRPYQKSALNEKAEDIDEVVKVSFRWVKIAMLAVGMGAYASLEINFRVFFSSALQYLPIHWTAQEAAWLTAVMSVTYSIGRLATIFISLFLSPDVILGYHLSTLAASLGALFAASAWSSASLFYVGAAGMGFGFAAVWPAFYSFTERHLRLTDEAAAIFSIFSGLCTFLAPLFLSSRLKSNPLILFDMSATCLALAIILFALVKLFVCLTPKKSYGKGAACVLESVEELEL